MTTLVIVLAAISALTVLGMLFCGFMLVRNEWVYDQVTRLLWTDYETYKRLPDYKTILNRFWVWDINKFLK